MAATASRTMIASITRVYFGAWQLGYLAPLTLGKVEILLVFPANSIVKSTSCVGSEHGWQTVTLDMKSMAYLF